MLFRSASVDEVRKAYMASATDLAPRDGLTEERGKLQTSLKRARNAYHGGADAVEMLIKRDTEKWNEWSNRRNHYRNVPVTKRAVRKQAWMVFGDGPELEVWIGEQPPTFRAKFLAKQSGTELENDATSDAFAEWVRDTLEQNRFDWLKQRAMRKRLYEGRAPLKIWPVDEDGMFAPPFSHLRFDLFATEDARPIYDPDDPDVLLGTLEARVHGKKVDWRLWTGDEIVWVNDSMDVVADAGKHPIPGVVPWAFLGDGECQIADLIEYQKVLINMHSVRWAVERSTAFPVGVVSGEVENEETELGGNVSGLDVGGGLRYLKFRDPQGGFSLVSANAPFAELRESYQGELREALWLGGGVPTDAMMDGLNAEQPTTIALRWLDSFIDRDERIGESTVWLDQIMGVMSAYGSEYNADFGLPSFNEGDVDWNWLFAKNPLPHDARMEADGQRMEVMGDLRLKADYVKGHVVPEADPDELELYMQQLEEQGKSANPFSFGAEPVVPPPPAEEEENAEA